MMVEQSVVSWLWMPGPALTRRPGLSPEPRGRCKQTSSRARIDLSVRMNEPMPEIHDLSATELLQRYRAKSLSPSEVFAALEQHIARGEPHLKALYAYAPETARKEAAASTERWAKGAPIGPLDGVAVTVKENIASKGTPLPLGTAAMPLTPMPEDAPPT